MSDFRTLFTEEGLAQWAFALLACLVPLYASAAFFPLYPANGHMTSLACDEYPLAATILCAAATLCAALAPLAGSEMHRLSLQKRTTTDAVACAMAALTFISLALEGIAPATTVYAMKAAAFVALALCMANATALMRPRPKATCVAAMAVACVFSLCLIGVAGVKLAATTCAAVAATLLYIGNELRTEFTTWDIPVSGSREAFTPAILLIALAVYAASCVTGETPAFATAVAAAIGVASVACTEGTSSARYASIVAVVASAEIAYAFGVNGHTGGFLLAGATAAFMGIALGLRGTLAGIGAATMGLSLPVAFDMGNPYGHIGFGDAQHVFETGDIVYLLATLAAIALCTLILALQESEPRISLRMPVSSAGVKSPDKGGEASD